MKEWIKAILKIVETTRQVEKNTKDIEDLKSIINDIESNAENLRYLLKESDDFSNEDFDTLTSMVEKMSATLTDVIDTIEDDDQKERIKSLRKGIKRLATIRSNNRYGNE